MSQSSRAVGGNRHKAAAEDRKSRVGEAGDAQSAKGAADVDSQMETEM